ncbi:MAG: ribosome maturation factor RimM [Melioribacteraceae bacterium]|nr:ribosome maturation factor RimM [Melioribacteraceae bacterium]MCF8356693.1 ribosome maturation factor RimM [Melioribacteraceae bacterium]MCF8393869.1 ribosome maturation factor RimM [Melioribacteraceae bacterium]MCF8418242.1 ribosome maturation factor RimM [Melioribacteraceae bacterium]
MNEFFLIAEIRSVYNDQGYLVFDLFSDFPERFYDLNEVYIEVFGDCRKFIVEDIADKKTFFVVKFKNFDDSKDVRFLLKKKVFIPSESAVILDDDTFFIHDLVDCKVFKNNKFFGDMIDVLRTPANDIYVINKFDGIEIMIPAVKEYIKDIDISNKIIHLTPDSDFLVDDEN